MMKQEQLTMIGLIILTIKFVPSRGRQSVGGTVHMKNNSHYDTPLEVLKAAAAAFTQREVQYQEILNVPSLQRKKKRMTECKCLNCLQKLSM